MQRPGSDRPEEPSEIPAMFSPAQMRLLWIAVIGMGILLLVGFATVIGRIIYLTNAPPKSETAPATAPLARSLPATAPIELPKGATIRHLAISENRLAVHFEGPSGVGIRIFDLGAPGRHVTLPIVAAPDR
ncbi:MAG: hypothetical protein R3D44_03855 [Hyphomicrobiaceae bacterium]